MTEEEFKEQINLEDGQFYVCEHHQETGGYEDCCSCDGERVCTELLDKLKLKFQ